MTKKKESAFDRLVLRSGAIVLVVLAALIGLFYWIVKDSWEARYFQSATVSAQTLLYGNGEDLTIEQKAIPPMETVQGLSLWTSKGGLSGTGIIRFTILRGDEELYTTDLEIEGMPDQDDYSFSIPDGILTNVRDQVLTLRITIPQTETGIPVTLAYGTSIDVGKFEVASQIPMDGLTLNGLPISGALCYKFIGFDSWSVMRWFFPVAALLVLACLGLIVWQAWKKKHGKHSTILYGIECCERYGFLIRQLVRRDFNVKYKRSMLGVVWSFLNPLLTMSVQYLVFSTIFRSSIKDFPVYLLSGIVCFNYFSESVSMGMESITGNASLINKVYMPKYIYPVSKVLSSLVNLLISLVPLAIVMLLSGVRFTKALLLIPIPLGLLVLFSLGMSFLLSTSNVFFRDTRFLWNVLSMIWMYLTPLFYPESIIPMAYRTIYHFNPMYQFIAFFRHLVCDGVTPPPNTYLWCMLSALIPMLLGIYVFRKKQDDFILYL